MALLATQQAGPTGLNPTFAAASAGGDTFVADGHTALIVKNGDSGSHNVTIASKKTAVPGLAVADQVVSVPASGERHILVDQGAFTDSGTGLVSVTYAAVTSVTVAAIRH